jgi:hypothetical protein
MNVSDVVDTLVSKISLLTRIIVSVLFQNIDRQNKTFYKWISIDDYLLFGYYFYWLILSMVSDDNWFMII